MTGAREVLIREASGGRSTAALWLISEDSHLTSGAITGPLIRFPSRRGDRSRHPGLGGMSPASDRLSRVDSGPCLAHLNEQVARKAVISNMVGDDQNWADCGLSGPGICPTDSCRSGSDPIPAVHWRDRDIRNRTSTDDKAFCRFPKVVTF